MGDALTISVMFPQTVTIVVVRTINGLRLQPHAHGVNIIRHHGTHGSRHGVSNGLNRHGHGRQATERDVR